MYARIGTSSATVMALPLLILALFAWFRPRAGGITATTWIFTILVLFTVRLFISRIDGISDSSIYWPISIVYLVGGIMHLLLPQQKNSVQADKRIKRAARIVTFGAPALYVILLAMVFAFRWPGGMGAGLLLFTPLAIAFGIGALYEPFAIGIVIIIIGVLFYSVTLITDHYWLYYVPLSSVFIAGGILHTMTERRPN